jgi:hypothetical protein
MGRIIAKYVLGREYEPGQRRQVDLNGFDMELQEWLKSNCVQCQHCGAYIEHVGGCDAVMCICGTRFCWVCQVTYSDDNMCDCYHEDFYDNVLGYDTTQSRPHATASQLENLKDYLEGVRDGENFDETEDDDETEEPEIVEEAKGVCDSTMFDCEEE